MLLLDYKLFGRVKFFLEIKALEHAANYLSNFLKHFIVLKK